MKMTIAALVFALGLCLCLLAYQQHRFTMQFDRQNQAIALVQSRCEASQQENRALRAEMNAKARTRTALLQAVPISARYQKMAPAPVAKRTASR